MASRVSVDGARGYQLLVKREAVEWWGICFFLLFSSLNIATLMISMVLSLVLLWQKEVGALKILNLLTLRTILNPGVAIAIENLQGLKWGIILLCSVYLILCSIRLRTKHKNELVKIFIAILAFAGFNFFSSLFFSTLPTIAIARLVSYVVVFVGVVVGVTNTYQRFDWVAWLYRMFAMMVFFSIPLTILPLGYLRNGHAFQGFTNHPNMFGIIVAMFVALIITKLRVGGFRSPKLAYIAIGIALIMGVISKSRTGVIAIIVLVLFHVIFINVPLRKKGLMYSIIGLALIYLTLDSPLVHEIEAFFFKGHYHLLFSRIPQLEGLVANFMLNPWFGSGFAVPVTSYRTFAFSWEFIVEPGNLILAVLSYGGIIGAVFFSAYMSMIYCLGRAKSRDAFWMYFAPILISMGEMVFFSSNNIGIFCYMFLALSLDLSTPKTAK